MNAITRFLLVGALAVACAGNVSAAVPKGTDVSGLNVGKNTEKNYRHRVFHAYMPLEKVRELYKINNYSKFENPTGIYFRPGDKVKITLTGTPESPVCLRTRNFNVDNGQEKEYALKPGVNEITIANEGLGYIDYRSEKPAEAPTITVDIEGGAISGVFTRADSNATWKKMLAETPSPILDLMGERVQLAFDVARLREYCPDDGVELLRIYDRVIEAEHEIMGWDIFDCHPGNHVLGRSMQGGFMHADGLGAAFTVNALKGITQIDLLRDHGWGVAHEFGHVNQVRPALMWAGTTEVTNNIYSAWSQYILSPKKLRLEHEVIGGYGGIGAIMGGRMDQYINDALVDRQLWQYMKGPDNDGSKGTGDAFVTVCPLWQLQLYNSVARGDKKFYARIHQSSRLKDYSKTPHGQLRARFTVEASKSAKLNFGEFFVKLGILAPMNRMVNDYSSHQVTITPAMCDAAIKEMAKFPKPDSSVIYYINGNNVKIFKDKAAVVPSPSFTFNAQADKRYKVPYCTVPADQWKNAVAFEAYAGKKLVRISLRGLGQEDQASTMVFAPEGTTEVKAVQWDGKRYTVWSDKQS